MFDKTQTKYLVKGLEMYEKQVSTMHTKAMQLGMFDSANDIKKELDEITGLKDRLITELS